MDAIQIGVYYETLGEFPLERVRDAALQWAQKGRFFPTTGEWCELVREMANALPSAVWKPAVVLRCPTCSDTGWIYKDCEAGQRCPNVNHLQQGSEFTHVYVVRCACFTAEPIR